MSFTLINGTPFSWTSCSFAIDNTPLGSGVQSLDFADARETKIVYASNKGGKPNGQTAGKYTCEQMSLKVLASLGQSICNTLSIPGLGSVSAPSAAFIFSMQAIELDGSVPLIMVADGCRVVGIKNSQAEGVDELVWEFSIQPLGLTRNGTALYDRIGAIGI